MYKEDLNKQQRMDEQGGCFALVAFFFVATIFAVFLLLSACSTKKSIATERVIYRDSLREIYHTAHDTTIYRDSFIREFRNDTLIIKEIKYIYQTKVEQEKEKEKDMETKEQRVTNENNWLYKDYSEDERVFVKAVRLPINAELWSECTNEEKEE